MLILKANQRTISGVPFVSHLIIQTFYGVLNSEMSFWVTVVAIPSELGGFGDGEQKTNVF